MLVSLFNGEIMFMRISTWYKWKDWNTFPNIAYPGIYFVAYSKDSLAGRTFNMTSKVAYVGMAHRQTLKQRLQQFDDTISGKKCRHGGADRMRYEHQDYRKLQKSLYVAMLHKTYRPKNIDAATLLSMGEVLQLEYFFFAEFFKLYGCLPKFNESSSKKFSKAIETF